MSNAKTTRSMSWSQAFLWLALIILIIFLGFRIINNGKNSDTKTTTDAQTDTTAESNAPDLGSAPPEGDLPPDGGGPPM